MVNLAHSLDHTSIPVIDEAVGKAGVEVFVSLLVVLRLVLHTAAAIVHCYVAASSSSHRQQSADTCTTYVNALSGSVAVLNETALNGVVRDRIRLAVVPLVVLTTEALDLGVWVNQAVVLSCLHSAAHGAQSSLVPLVGVGA